MVNLREFWVPHINKQFYICVHLHQVVFLIFFLILFRFFVGTENCLMNGRHGCLAEYKIVRSVYVKVY